MKLSIAISTVALMLVASVAAKPKCEDFSAKIYLGNEECEKDDPIVITDPIKLGKKCNDVKIKLGALEVDGSVKVIIDKKPKDKKAEFDPLEATVYLSKGCDEDNEITTQKDIDIGDCVSGFEVLSQASSVELECEEKEGDDDDDDDDDAGDDDDDDDNDDDDVDDDDDDDDDRR